MAVEMGYWSIRGLGSVLRMIFEYKEAEYKDAQYSSGEDWFKVRKPEILSKNPLANLPYLVDGDTCVCQTNAILVYLGDKYGLSGGDKRENMKNLELLCEIYDVRNGMIDLVYPFKQVTRSKEEFDKNAASKCAAQPFAKFEDVLKANGFDWFVSKSGPCVADFHIWEMLDQHKLLAEKIGAEGLFAGDKFPHLKAFYERFRALPTLAKYFASEAYKLPINNPGAGAYFV